MITFPCAADLSGNDRKEENRGIYEHSKKYGNYELHPKMKIDGYEKEIWDKKTEIIEELKRAAREKQKKQKKCILAFKAAHEPCQLPE